MLSGGPQPSPRAPDVNALLAQAAARACGVTFVGLREHEAHLSWAEVLQRARRVAAALAERGVAPGDRVAIVLRTEPAFLDAFFGVLLAGAVAVPLYPPVRFGRLEEYLAGTARMVHVSGARLLLSGGAVRRLLGEVVARARPALGCLAVEGLERGSAELGRPVSPSDLALVQFSSGSTVDPKPVALSHANVVAQTASILAVLRPTPEDALVSWLPLYHDMGLIGGLLGAASYPGPCALLAPEHFLARPALWLRALSRHRGTISPAPSFAYAYAAERVKDEDLAGHDLSAWRVAFDGAEPVAPAVLRRFAERFAPFGFDARALTPVYGLSEAALAVTFTPPGRGWRTRPLDPAALASRGEVVDGSREVVSVGVPVPGVEVAVRGEDGRELPERRLGRIFVRGASVMQGYLGQPDATARALPGGWLDTGDLGFVDEGELYVHGRIKDVIIARGANHAPDELEAPLAAVPGLRPGCAVALGFQPDGEGEELLLLAERASGGDPAQDGGLVDAARRAVLERTGVRAHTVEIVSAGTLPRTSSGKLRRGEALRRWQAGELAPPRRPNALTMAGALARSAVAYAKLRLGS
ncbi:MAG TPA: AMP-binding protein [Anaeromyxobacteraceae bacterium]|nr:AMP-binding protein [Anaeromyxobacteraceae bacterium]